MKDRCKYFLHNKYGQIITKTGETLGIHECIRPWVDTTKISHTGTGIFICKGYTCNRCPISWIKLAACCLYDSSLSVSKPNLLLGVFASCSFVKYHFSSAAIYSSTKNTRQNSQGGSGPSTNLIGPRDRNDSCEYLILSRPFLNEEIEPI